MPIALLLALLALIPLAAAEKPRTGVFQLSFTERSPLSAWAEQVARYSGSFPDPWSNPAVCPPRSVYDIAKEPFDVSVPASYDGSVAFGLIAYVNSGDGGGTYQYQQLLAKHRLIWIGGTKIGNERDVPSRIGLTIDAVHNMRQRYRIDPDRIYVSGTSGGGRTASMMAITYADVFTGGAVYLIGCNNMTWPTPKQTAERVRALVPNHRFVFMTRSDDFNRSGTYDVYQAYQAEKLPHLKYIEESGGGHTNPSDEAFDQAITFLDAPLIERVQSTWARAEALAGVEAKRIEAWAAYREVAASAIQPELAAKAKPKLVELAALIETGLAADLDKLLAAKPNAEKLRAFAAKWADFPSGGTAKAKAEEIGGAELDAMLAKMGKPPVLKPLRAFIRTWEGYDVGQRALTALDGYAQTAWAPVAAMPAGDKRLRALAKFAAEWAPSPTAVAAEATFTEELAGALATITAEPRPMLRGQKLQAFATAWKGTASGSEADQAVAALAAALQGAKTK